MKRWVRVFSIAAAGFLAPCGVLAGPLPQIPASERVLSLEDVRNFWINTLNRRALPPKPSGLHPASQASWRRKVDARRAQMRVIRNGERDTEARLVQLRHNITAWRAQGDEVAAEDSERKLRELTEHLARLETLRLQREAAEAQIETAKKVKALEAEIGNLEAEISALRVDCSQSCPGH